MKKLFRIILTLSVISLTGCASSKVQSPVPDWLYNFESAFPAKDYIAKMGEGTSELIAKNNSTAELASYFSVNVKRVIESNEQGVKDGDEKALIVRSYNSSVITTTDLNLFALETTKPYYSKQDRKWYCVSYISKEKAWSVYEPFIKQKEMKFLSVYNYAVEETDPLKKILLLNYSRKDGQEFVDALFKALILSSERTEKEFGQTRDLFINIDKEIAVQKKKCKVFLNIKNDRQNIIASQIRKVLEDQNLTVVMTKGSSFYELTADIDFNLIEEDELFGAVPSIKIELISGDECLLSYCDNVLEKILSYDKSNVEKKSLEQLSQIIDVSLRNYLKKIFEN